MIVVLLRISVKTMSVSAVVGWIFIVVAILPQPFGNFFIKKSFELEPATYISSYNMRLLGNFLLVAVSPVLHVLAYLYGQNAFIAPILSSGVLISIILAWQFLEERKYMNSFTLFGVCLFSSGLFSILWTYSKLLSGENINDLDESVDWGAFSLYLGVWVWALTVMTCIALFSHAKALVVWSIIAAVICSLNVVATYDK